MLLQILTNIHNVTTLLFGIFISAFFLGVKQNRKNIITLSLFFCFVGLLYIISFAAAGETFANQIYPLIVHLPLALFLTFYYKYPFISSMVSVFSAYLCCQISNWIGLFVLNLSKLDWCYYTARIVTTILTFLLLCHFVCHTTETLFAKGQRELSMIGFLPLVYYIFDYISTKFSSLLYSGNKAIVEFMGFAFCIAYLIFLFFYVREYEQKQEIRQYSNLMEMQLHSIQKEIEYVKSSEKTLSILRHDMRHHLNLILTLLQNHNTEQAMAYIRKIDDSYDHTVFTTYCKNEMINSVLSIYQTRFSNEGATLHCEITVGETLPCPDIAICTILSNALENSMHALTHILSAERWAKLTISTKGDHLLLACENPVQKIPKFVDGIPTSSQKGHGVGVKSIVYYVEQLNGQCHFSVSDHTFILRIII